MKKLWKKPAVRITAAAVAVVALALLGLWIWSLRPPPEITFDFLNSRDVTPSMEDVRVSSPYRIIRYSYILAADFNDICLSADAELMKLGYGPPIYPGPTERHYKKHVTFGNSVSVIIRKMKLTKYSKPNPSDYPSFYSDERDYSEGCVSVEIFQLHLRFWPPHHLLYDLKMRFSSAWKKP